MGDPRRYDSLGASVAVSGDGATVLASAAYRRLQQDPGLTGRGMVVGYRTQ